jgi:uncharacterized protein (DUF1501 family)
LDLVRSLNRLHAEKFPENTDLSARLRDFETAARMQSAVPDVVDIDGESPATLKMYGMDRDETRAYGKRCLLARRLVERGVRFVGVYLKGQPWDTHSDNANGTKAVAGRIEQPSAALVRDLKQRGLLDSTVVVWMGEFGRTPQTTSGGGRNHWARAWSSVLVGGGIKGGQVVGKTDRQAAAVVERPISVTDFLGTVCTKLGIDYKKENRSPGVERPIPIVDTSKGVKVISELL